MRDQHLTSLRQGMLAALGLLPACGNDGDAADPDAGQVAIVIPDANLVVRELPGADCRALDVSEAPTGYDCWDSTRYAWDGTRCVPLYCGCVGVDCGAVFGAAADCYAARSACDGMASERAACIERYPIPNGDSSPGATGECKPGGITACNAGYITEGAARCIAESEGLAPGIKPWTVSVPFYDSQHRRIARNVSSTIGPGNYGGDYGAEVSLDAVTGVVLDSRGWVTLLGRPFLVDRAPRTSEATPRADYAVATSVCLDEIPADVRAALAAEWARIGLLEHASVAAFARFALQLLGVGAPPELVESCQRAMQDELRHAQLAFSLASAYAAAPLGPGPLKLDGALDASHEDLLEHVTLATFLEGCIGETIAALDAREGASAATDPFVRRVLSEVAADEERHAQLAWRFVDWALTRRPALAASLLETARAVLAEAVQRRASGVPAPNVERGPGLEAALLEHGFLPRAQRLELEVRGLESVILPCSLALAAKHGLGASYEPPGGSRGARAPGLRVDLG